MRDELAKPNTPGQFITFEGIEGSGKSSQIQSFRKYLEDRGYQVQIFREPGATATGEKIRQVLLESKTDIHPLAEAYLFCASRIQLLEKEILPWISKDKHVALVDRYLDSTLAYQGVAGGLGFEKVIDIHSHSPLNTLPHMTFYLQISLKTSMDRQQIRGNEKDYFESRPKEFHQKLIEGYDKAAHEFQDRFIVIDGEKSMEEVFSEITQAWEGYES